MVCGFTRTAFRVALIAGLAVGGLALIAGHERVAALFDQARDSINSHIDKAITDPVALRAQLRSLEGQYPQRIAQVRSDLGEVRGQMQQLQRELQVSSRVSDLASRDLDALQSMIAQAESLNTPAIASQPTVSGASFRGDDDGPAHASPRVDRRVELVFGDSRLSLDQAYTRATEITNTKNAYVARANDIQRDLGYLTQQETRLANLLNKLEGERAEFQVQLWQLDRQVDSIARNERMIDVLSRRQKSIDEVSRYKVASLDQLNSRVADLRAKQEAQLASLTVSEGRSDYEQRAKLELDRAASKNIGAKPAPAKVDVIEIRPSNDPVGPAAPAAGKSLGQSAAR